MKSITRQALVLLLMHHLVAKWRALSFVPRPPSHHHHHPLSHEGSQLGGLGMNMAWTDTTAVMDLDNTILYVGLGAVAYFSSYVTDGYEPHAL